MERLKSATIRFDPESKTFTLTVESMYSDGTPRQTYSHAASSLDDIRRYISEELLCMSEFAELEALLK